jgi:hypothetical protein
MTTTKNPHGEPPALPARPPDRFQFHLKHLLAFMFVSALGAACLRPILQAVERLPDGWMGTWIGMLTLSLALGAAAYVLLRGPFLVWHAVRLSRRWDTVQTHRRQLTEWAKSRGSKPAPIIDVDGEPEA